MAFRDLLSARNATEGVPYRGQAKLLHRHLQFHLFAVT